MKKRSLSKEDINKTFPIVGIGASAGGLEALEVFFANMPSDSGISFVVIQHLDPKRKSIMGTILERYTKMKVLEIEDRMKVKPNCIYLNPPNKNIEIINRTLYLAEPTESRRIRLPIDSFLRSLAMDQREKAICIILSGTGTDGTLGLKAVKGEGGITLVQEEEQAKYSGMPESAIDTGLVDCILPVEKMPGELLKYSRHPYIKGKPIPVTAPEQLKSCIEKIFMIIRSTTGHDFSNYKQSTIRRRLERRMALHQINRLQDYVRYLQQNRSEVETVAMDMLIGVTSFFRDPDAIEAARLAVYPESIVADVTADRLKRFFMKNDNTFRIKKQIREMVIFAVQDVIKDSMTIKLTVMPVKEPASGQNLVMVVFEDMTPPPKKSEMKEGKPPSAQKAGLRIQTLEQELQSTREYLQTTIEELETSNEELRSTNEELQSTSEELQSTNEEMETSKEELQSINEELVIVNSDLQDKVNELSRANNDLHNLLSTTEIGIIFLDTALC